MSPSRYQLARLVPCPDSKTGECRRAAEGGLCLSRNALCSDYDGGAWELTDVWVREGVDMHGGRRVWREVTDDPS